MPAMQKHAVQSLCCALRRPRLSASASAPAPVAAAAPARLQRFISSTRASRRSSADTPDRDSLSRDPHPILSELQRRGATSPSSSTTSGPHLGPFPLPADPPPSDSASDSARRQARIDASSRQWSQLGVAERAGVVATQGASLVVVVAGAGLFALVAYAFTSELFSEASPTRIFEDCVERVKKDNEVRPRSPSHRSTPVPWPSPN